jgi:Tfp pilus assembly protein PilF
MERYRTTRESNVAARELYRKALDIDPRYADASLGLSWTYLQAWQFLWSTDPETLERARELAERAIALDAGLVKGYSVLAQIYLWRKEHDRAIAQAERAVALAPNDADGYETLAEVLAWSGRPVDSERMIRQAMRLNPRYPFFYLWTLGHDYYLTERRQEALTTLDSLIQRNPNFLAAHAYRAVLYTELGQDKRAREAWDRTRELSPGASLVGLRQHLPYRQPADLDRFMRGLEKAMGH